MDVQEDRRSNLTEHATANWYEKMTEAMRKREKALVAIDRWQTALHVAEQEIAELATQQRPLPPLGSEYEPVVLTTEPSTTT